MYSRVTTPIPIASNEMTFHALKKEVQVLSVWTVSLLHEIECKFCPDRCKK